jgi:CIC family chloride channel protein
MSEDTFHLLIAGLVGILGGLTQFAYHGCHHLLQLVFLGGAGDILDLARHMPPILRLLTPALGGFAAGMVLHLGLRIVGRGGFSNLLEVVVAGDGRLRLRPALVNALSSLVSMSTGASVGREGLIIQLSSALSSRLGQAAGWPPYRLRMLVACGAASGLAASYNAPIAGAVFAAQIVLGNFAMNLFAPVVLSSVIATMVSRSFLPVGQWYMVPTFNFNSVDQLPWFVALGVASGLLGAWFLGLLRWSEAAFTRLRAPIYLKLGIAGLLVGAIALRYPEVWGNGYGATNEILGLRENKEMLGLLLGLFSAKLIATVVTVGSGTVGGIFTPTLFLGAALGSAFGASLHLLGLGAPLPMGAFALVGMASVLAATTHSPLLAMITVFEMSLNYSMMPALMIACVVGAVVGRRFARDSIYTEPLRRKGLEAYSDTGRVGGAAARRIGDFMQDPVPPLRENSSFREIADRFLTGSNNFLPVVDAEGQLAGVVALQDLKEYLQPGTELHGVIASDVMRPPPASLTPDQKLADALPTLVTSELRNVPVVSSRRQPRLIGRVSRSEVLSTLSEMLTSPHLP